MGGSCCCLRGQRVDMFWRNQSGGGLRPRQGAWSVFLVPQSNTHQKGSHSQPDFFCPSACHFQESFILMACEDFTCFFYILFMEENIKSIQIFFT